MAINYDMWKTQDGRHLKLSEMNEVHIQNCINMLNRQINDALRISDCLDIIPVGIYESIVHRKNYIKSFKKELKKRVDKTNAMCYNNYSKKNNNNINLKEDVCMDTTNGYIGGYIVKKMIEAQERQMQNGGQFQQTKNKGDNYMKTEKISRQLDDLNRVVIPVEMRRALGIHSGDTLELSITKNTIEIRKDVTAERQRLAKQILQRRIKGVDFIRNGNSIICFRKVKDGKSFQAKTGVSMCSPADNWNEDVGRAIAYLRMLGENVPEVLIK